MILGGGNAEDDVIGDDGYASGGNNDLHVVRQHVRAGLRVLLEHVRAFIELSIV